MTVLGENDEWPTWCGNSLAGVSPRRKSIDDLIYGPWCRFHARTGKRPTHLLLGWNARRQLASELSVMPTFALPHDPNRKREYRGMTLIFMDQNGIELLNDLDIR